MTEEKYQWVTFSRAFTSSIEHWFSAESKRDNSSFRRHTWKIHDYNGNGLAKTRPWPGNTEILL